MRRDLPNVLLVDDNEANLLALGAILVPLPANVIKASSGTEALKFLLKEECALILLDVQMPELDGFETAALIRGREQTRYTPIVFVTAIHREEKQILKGYTHGAIDYLIKPLEPDTLVAKVRVFLEQHNREKGIRQEAALRTRERDELQRLERTARAEADAQRDRLYALFMQAPAAIAIIHGAGNVFELANERFEQMIGKTKLLGREGREVIPSSAAASTWEVMENVYRTGQPFLGNEYPGLFGLENRLFNFVAQPANEQGKTVAVMFHAVEVTEAVRAHQELEQAARGKDEFLAMLGHELRNPLAPILSALQLMNVRAQETAGVREREIIERQIKHLSRLVDDLLDVSRATMGKIDLRREPLEVASAVARAVEVSAPLLESKGQELSVTVAGAGLLVMGDPVRLAQVLGNLLNNASKYSDPGGHIQIDARRDGAEVVISVRDDGRGIAADRLGSMFDLFVQGDQPADRSQGGLGIGLTLARCLVQLHGGRVDAFSGGAGKGSHLVVRLPAIDEPAAREATPALRVPGARTALARVLVVDDNLDAAEMLSLALRHAGHEVHEEHDGLSALVTAARVRPDVVLLDLGLPRLDGFEVARRIRADESFAGTRIVAITGYGQEADRRRTAEVGIDRHLVKPVDLDTIVDAINSVRVTNRIPEHLYARSSGQ